MTYIDNETAEWAASLLGYRPKPQPYTEPPAALTFNRPAWHARAACAGMGHTLWFPESGDSHAEAVAICGGCPVRPECLEFAMDQETRSSGIWGGLTGVQRRAYRARKRAA